MNAQQEQTISTLRELIATCRDGQEGFRTASECVLDDPELKMLLSSFSLQRAKFAGELEALAISMGETHPEHEQSSMAGAAHRGWIHLKAALTRDENHAILAECERGEDSAKKAYNDAMTHEMPDPIREVVLRQRQEVLTAHNTIRALRDGTSSRSASEVMASAKEKVRIKTDKAAATATEVWHQMKDKGSDLRQSTERVVRRSPWLTLAGVLLAGFSIGLIIRLLEARREEKQTWVRRGTLGKIGLGVAAWLGLMGRRARRQYETSLQNVQHRVEEFADKLPENRFVTTRRRRSFFRRFIS